MRLHDFRVLSFDCYGTLIDWETGIIAALAPLLANAPMIERNTALEAFARHESAQESATPGMLYSELLAIVYGRLAAEWHLSAPSTDARRFAAAISSWPAFPDTPAALRYLKQHFQVVILSNVDRRGFASSKPHLGIGFDAAFTAEDIGSYKPNAANFRYLLDRIAERGIERSAILHTAQSLYHDHAPAKRAGLVSCWIDRRQAELGFGATPPPSGVVRPDFHFPSLAAMVEAHRLEAPN